MNRIFASPFRMLCACGFLAILSTTMAKNPALPLFAQHLGAGSFGIGLVSALSPLAGVLLSIPGGLLSDRIGRRTMLLVSSLVFASAPFAYLFVSGVWSLGLARFYHGLATGVFMPVAQAAVADAHSEAKGEKLGTFSAATLAGRFLAPMLGGGILWIGALATTRFGFQAVYVACGLAGIGVLILAWRLPRFEDRQPETAPRPAILASLRSLAANRSILSGCVLEAGILFAYGTFEAFLPIVAKTRGLAVWVTGALFSAQIITVALTKPLFGRFSDRYGRVGQMLGGAAIMACALAAIPWIHGLPGLFALSVVLGLALSIATAATSAYVADLARQHERGAAMGLMGSIMDIGHSTGPLAAGAVAVLLGPAGAFATGAIILLGCAWWAFRARRD